jgi:hypothetical protein
MFMSRMSWPGNVARIWENIKAYRLMVGNPERNRPLGRQRYRWVDKFMMCLVDIGWGMWTGLAWLRI